ncbi:MAG: ABC transporter ATP-binding protein [Anaerolineae bacterium]|nr:ABC transporter ATP-binding protein [Anaerolineae bacterium]
MEKKHPVVRLWKYAAAYRPRIVLASIFSVLNKIFDLAPPALIGLAVDIVASPYESFFARRLGVVEPTSQIWLLAGITLVVWMFESLFQYIYQLAWRNLAQAVQHDMRVETYDHVQHLELAYFEDRSTGGLMSILNDDINQLERFLDVGASDLIQVTTTVLVISGVFIYLAPTVAWMALIPMPFIIWGSVKFQHWLAPRYARVREQVGILNGILSNNLTGVATIKSFTAEAHEVDRVTVESRDYWDANRRAIQLSAAFVPLIRMVIVGGFIAITVAGGFLVVKGSGRLTVASYSTMMFMTQRLLWPLTRLGETFDLYQRAMASIDRIMNLLDTKPRIVDGPVSLPFDNVKGEIVFDDVTFRYDSGNLPVVESLDLQVKAGQTVAIVGPTGSGKSTVVKLLLRFYDLTGGHITVDGHDLPSLNLTDLRKAVGYVSQDVYIFHGTVRENIAYGTFDATDEAIIEAAKIAEAHTFITELPQGYDTIVGERGQKLSGGQRQRLSLARAVLKDPPILVLDEATSAVDNETEAAIQRSLERIVVDRTTIMIAHRLSTIRHSDWIVVLEKGEIAEQGRHEELLARNGLYAALWRVQTGEKVVAAS